MANDRLRSTTLTGQDLAAPYVFPDDPPEELLRGLTGQEMQFVRAYVESGDSRWAFAKAGLEHGQRHPKQLAYQYLKRPRVKAAVDRLQNFYAHHHTGLHASQLLTLLKAQATLDPLPLYAQHGTSWELKPLAQWPLEARQSIQKVKVQEWVTEDGTKRQVEVEFCDRLRAISLLGKHLRLFERREQVAPFTLVINSSSEPTQPKPVGQTVIEGVNLRINLPDEEGGR